MNLGNSREKSRRATMKCVSGGGYPWGAYGNWCNKGELGGKGGKQNQQGIDPGRREKKGYTEKEEGVLGRLGGRGYGT